MIPGRGRHGGTRGTHIYYMLYIIYTMCYIYYILCTNLLCVLNCHFIVLKCAHKDIIYKMARTGGRSDERGGGRRSQRSPKVRIPK